jgi:prepilin-type N-terminal cleavage/methylation domain-containing protein
LPLKFKAKTLKGFTLIEILVAVTLIATIVSMVYGSYFATAKSADIYKTRITLSRRIQRVLCQMARQIRCSYIGEEIDDTNLVGTNSDSTNTIGKSPVIYFSYDSDAPGSRALHFVTTSRLFCEDGYAKELIDVAYRFDKNIGTFYLSQRRFTGTTESNVKDRNWRLLLTNVVSVELEFFDGQLWLQEWDFEQKRKLPIAVKVGITCEDENSRQCYYSTIAYVDCARNQGQKTLFETSVTK